MLSDARVGEIPNNGQGAFKNTMNYRCTICDKSDSPLVIFGVCRRCATEIKVALNNHREGKWSQYYDACVVCNDTRRAVKAWGKCKTCYQRENRKQTRQTEAAKQREKVRIKLFEGKYSSKDNRCIACERGFEKGEEKIDTSVSGEKITYYHKACYMKELE